MNSKTRRSPLVASAILAAIMSANAAVAAEDEPEMPGETQIVPGEFLVRFADEVTDARIAEINARFGVEVVDRLLDGAILLVRVPDPALLSDIMVLYEATPGVLYVEPNFVVETQGQGTNGPEIQ